MCFMVIFYYRVSNSIHFNKFYDKYLKFTIKMGSSKTHKCEELLSQEKFYSVLVLHNRLERDLHT